MMNAPRSYAKSNRLRLLSGGSIMAAALASLLSFAQPAHAQFNGNGTVTSGTATNPTGASSITVTGTEVVIDWDVTTTPGASSFVFLDAGNQVQFQNDSTLDYTVLNRITDPSNLTASAIFNGRVVSTRLDPGAGTGQIQGGNIWFYSPGRNNRGPGICIRLSAVWF